MDFKGSDYAGQRDRSEESLSNIRKEQREEKEEETARRKSDDSLGNVGSRDSAENQPRRDVNQKAGQQSGNYTETREQQTGGDRQGNFSDGSTANLYDQNVSEHGDPDPQYDNFGSGNDEAIFDANQNNNLHGNCQSGINISVVAQREFSEEKLAIEPKYNVSFKSCYDR